MESSNNYIKILNNYYKLVKNTSQNMQSDPELKFHLLNIRTRKYLVVDGYTVRDEIQSDSIRNEKKLFILKRESDNQFSLHFKGNKNTYSLYTNGKKLVVSLVKKSVFYCVSSEDAILMSLQTVENLSEQVASLKELFIKNFPITEVPKANGALRDFQIDCLGLLTEFNNYCALCNVNYWIDGGTLLGAVRHNGFIPWDDDIDVCMLYSDFQKLSEYFMSRDKFISELSKSRIINSTKDKFGTYLVDFYPYTYKLKFFNKHKKINPSIDIFVYYNIPNERTVEEQLDLVRKINSKSKQIIKKYGVKEYKRFIIDELESISSPEPCKYISLGLQTYSKRFYSRKFDEIFPLIKLNFEGHELSGPREFKKILTAYYGDYFQYPENFNSHFFNNKN